jgi:lipoyl-dependent peroxiredoxin subunit C
MIGVGEKLPDFKVVGVKPKFMKHEENGQSAFETLTQDSFPGQWKVIFFYPKDFTFVCPTEIAEFARLNPQFAERDAVVLGGSTDNEHSKLGWRREHPDLNQLAIWNFADNSGKFARALGVLDEEEGVALRATLSWIRTGRCSTSTSTTSMSDAIRRTPCACSTPCKPTSFAHATARSAGTFSNRRRSLPPTPPPSPGESSGFPPYRKPSRATLS